MPSESCFIAGIFSASGEKTRVLLESEPEPESEPAAGWVPSLPQAASVIKLPTARAARAALLRLEVGCCIVNSWFPGRVDTACGFGHRKQVTAITGNPDRSDGRHRRPLFPRSSGPDLA